MSSSPTPSTTSTLHPLHLPSSSPFASSSSTFASTSAYDPTSSSSSSRAPSPVNRSVRSRKPPPLPPPPPSEPNLFQPDNNDDSADVTRPNLRKATKDALGLAGRGSETGDESGRYSTFEKGKQRESRRAASEALYSEKDGEREVVVHKVSLVARRKHEERILTVLDHRRFLKPILWLPCLFNMASP